MDAPEYLVCVNCETPCYVFEWDGNRVTEAYCTACAADDLDEFLTQDEYDALEAG